MTLGQWFRDYVYIPLGGNRKGASRQVLNILIVWALTGIWHGANWNFLLWGLWFALFLILEKVAIGKLLHKLPGIFGMIYMACIVLVGWVLFAIEDVSVVFSYLMTMFGVGATSLYDPAAFYLLKEYAVLLGVAIVASTPLGRGLAHRLATREKGPAIAMMRWMEKVIPGILLIISIAYIVDASYNPFLYFRF